MSEVGTVSEVRELRLRIHYEKDHIWAEVEELPGCFAAGADVDELREALAEAISMYLAPNPDARPVVTLDFQPPPAVRRIPARIELVPC